MSANFNDCLKCKHGRTCKIAPMTCDLKWFTLSNKDLEEHDKQIRAEVIDSLVKLVCEYGTGLESKGIYSVFPNTMKQTIADMAEQLKQQP